MQFFQEFIDQLCRAAVSLSQSDNIQSNSNVVTEDNAEKTMQSKRKLTEFIHEILNKMHSFSLVQQRKSKRVQYTLREIRIALYLYSMTPSEHRELSNSNLRSCPSI